MADWRSGHRSLEARIRALPASLRAGIGRMRDPEPPLPADARRFVLTGVGSSAAHARYLAHILRDGAGIDARVLPLSAFVEAPGSDPADTVLIVVSQGLSPNVRLALAGHAAWRRVVLLTASSEEGARVAGDSAKASLIADLAAAGVAICPFPAGENEYETLVRVVGPIAGYLATLRLGAAIAPQTAPAWDLAAICAALASAPARLDRVLGGFDLARLGGGVAFLTSGGYGDLVDNLRFKVLEGFLLPAPPVWDLLDVAHGPLQQAHAGRTTFIALTRRDAPFEEELLASVERALDPERHALLRLDATLPGPLAVFDHEGLMNELMLRFIACVGVDQINWPGRGRDRELYELGSSEEVRSRRAGGTLPLRGARRRRSRFDGVSTPLPGRRSTRRLRLECGRP